MANIFQKIISNLKLPVLSGSPDSVVGIDIGSSSIKIVELKKERGKIVLATYGEVALGPYNNKPIGFGSPLDPDIIATALLDVMKESNVTSRTGVFAMQSSASLIFIIKLPKSALSSLDEIVPNEARKYIPVPISEVTLNWSIIPSHVQESFDMVAHTNVEDYNEVEVLVAAVRNDALASYKNITAQVALKALHYEIEVFSAMRSTFHNELAPIALIDMGASQTRIALIQYGTIMKYHTINRGGVLITETIARSLNLPFDRAETLKRSIGLGEGNAEVARSVEMGVMSLISEIKSVLFDFEKQYNKAIDRIIVVGGGGLLVGLPQFLSDKLQVPVQLGDPFRKTAKPEFLEGVLSSVGPEFAIATGAALYEME